VVSSPAVALFLQGLALGFSAAAQPGPFQAYLLAQSLRNGAARTMPVVLVPLVSDPPVIAAVLAVLAQVPAGFLRVLQVAGGAVVLWLGAGALRAAWRPPAAEPANAPPRGFVRAIAVNFTNPNAWIFWSLVGGPILAEAWRAAPARAAIFLAGFYLLLVGGNAGLVLAAAQASRLGPAFARGLGAASGVALVLFGLWQVGRGVAGA
jgi:threonine/homoserine/homoserine lactone efflux protein